MRGERALLQHGRVLLLFVQHCLLLKELHATTLLQRVEAVGLELRTVAANRAIVDLRLSLLAVGVIFARSPLAKAWNPLQPVRADRAVRCLASAGWSKSWPEFHARKRVINSFDRVLGYHEVQMARSHDLLMLSTRD